MIFEFRVNVHRGCARARILKRMAHGTCCTYHSSMELVDAVDKFLEEARILLQNEGATTFGVWYILRGKDDDCMEMVIADVLNRGSHLDRGVFAEVRNV